MYKTPKYKGYHSITSNYSFTLKIQRIFTRTHKKTLVENNQVMKNLNIIQGEEEYKMEIIGDK